MRLYKDSYKSIDDLPIYNWNEIHRTGNLVYLLRERKKLNEFEKVSLGRRWTKIYDEYIKHFGFSETFIKVIEKQMYIAELMIEKAETGDKTINTFIEIERRALEKLKEKTGDGDFYESKAMMEKQLGFTIDVKKCSVVEFYSYIKSIEKDAKRTGN